MDSKRKTPDADLESMKKFCEDFQQMLGPAMKKCKTEEQLVALVTNITGEVLQFAAKSELNLPAVSKSALKEASSKKIGADKTFKRYLNRNTVPVSSNKYPEFRQEEESADEKYESTAFKQISFWSTIFFFFSVSVASGVSLMNAWDQQMIASLVFFGQAVCLFFFGSIFDKVNAILEQILCLVISKFKMLLWTLLIIVMLCFLVVVFFFLVDSLNLDPSTKYIALAFCVTIFCTILLTVEIISWLT